MSDIFQVLIVEDNSDKLRHIYQLIEKLPEAAHIVIDHELDAVGAKRRLSTQTYDLLILDIALPSRISSDADPTGGLKLLNEIQNRDKYYVPVHIIGLTAYEDSFEQAQAVFGDALLSIIQYDQTSSEWRVRLTNGLSQRVTAKLSAAGAGPDYLIDVAFVCALPLELRGILRNGWTWERQFISHDDTAYHFADFRSLDGSTRRAVAAVAPRMGMPAATALASKMICTHRPRFLVMTGIMAGISGEVEIGDIVVANPIWDWGSGKWSTRSTEDGRLVSHFDGDPFQYSVGPTILNAFRAVAEDSQLLFEVRNAFGRGAPSKDFQVLFGPVASGAAVLADAGVVAQIQQQHRKLLGVEMEGYGIFAAAAGAARPAPQAVFAKAVVDYADPKKNDGHQEFGAFTSACIASAAFERFTWGR